MTVSERRSMTRGSEGAAGAGLDGGELDTENIHKTALQWGLGALCHGIQIFVEAFGVCHRDLRTEYVAGWQFCLNYDVCAQA